MSYNVGFTTFFAYRPHVEHMYYLSLQIKKAGHTPFYLNCFGGFKNCYTLALKKSPRIKECPKCIVGSLYSYANENTGFVSSKVKAQLSSQKLKELTESSSYTITRIEDYADKMAPDVLELQKSLHGPVEIAYENTKQWILKNKLDYVFLFNGRIDVTRAALEACRELNVKFTSVERTWLGNGIQLNPNENCLSLKALHDLINRFMEFPLKKEQAYFAADTIASRFLGNNLEWRVYNTNAREIRWPKKFKKYKVLILPSSKNEKMGQADWQESQGGSSEYFLKVINKLNIPREDCVLRGHPQWAENIASTKGGRISGYYKKWCSENNIFYIGPEADINTRSLMIDADLILLNGSSSVYESNFLGTPTVCVSPSQYQCAGISHMVLNDKDIDQLTLEAVLNTNMKEFLRKTLRYLYIFGHRYSLFSKNIVARSQCDYLYSENMDVERLFKMIDDGVLYPDDETVGDGLEFEDEVIQLIVEKKWIEINNFAKKYDQKGRNDLRPISRRGVFKVVSPVRNLFRKGDL